MIISHSRFSIPVVTVLVPVGLSSWRSLVRLPDYKSMAISIATCTYQMIFSSLSLSDNLVRAGFQSLQLVIADFLPAIPPSCVPSCVEVGGQYGLQTMDINISLTSIGILVRGHALLSTGFTCHRDHIPYSANFSRVINSNVFTDQLWTAKLVTSIYNTCWLYMVLVANVILVINRNENYP